MSDATDTTSTEGESTSDGDQKQQEQKMVPQSEVDRIVKERIARTEAKYADYTELKAKAEGSKTLEQRLAELETELTTTKTAALKTSIAARFGISTEPGAKGEPSDADLFLTGSDVDALTAQAQRLAGREADRKKNGNIAPREGDTKSTGDTSSHLRAVARELFKTST